MTGSEANRWIWATAALVCGLHPETTFAQDHVTPELSGSVEVATDDRFRGYTRSAGEPVARASLDVAVPIGARTTLFSGATGSVTGSNPDYGALQTQFYAGVEQEAGAFRLTLGGRGYIFPNVAGKDYYEIFGDGRTQIGPISAKLGFALAPGQRHYGGRRGIYIYSDLETGIPGTPLTAAAHYGWEDNARFSGKSDWSLSLVYIHSPWSLGLGYTDTNRSALFARDGKQKDGAGAALVATLGASF